MRPEALLATAALAMLTAGKPVQNVRAQQNEAVPAAPATAAARNSAAADRGSASEQRPQNFHQNVREMALQNNDFRRVVWTGRRMQLVLMAIPQRGEIGEETHANVEQALFIVSGSGRVVIDGQASPVTSGDVLIAAPGTRHNLVNAGEEPLRLYTIYSPANHIQGRVHATKADAEADTANEAFGNAVQ